MSTEIEDLVKEYGGSVLEFDKLCRWLLTCLFFNSKDRSVFYRNTLIKCDGANNKFNLIYSNYENAFWKENQISIVDYTKHLYGMECFTALEQICILDLVPFVAIVNLSLAILPLPSYQDTLPSFSNLILK